MRVVPPARRRADPYNSVDRVAELSPLGGLERWLYDPAVTDLVVNGGEVWIDRGEGLMVVGAISSPTLDGVVERMLSPLGRRLDRSQPMVDARLADGSRVCIATPPVAVDGTYLAIRRFPSQAIGLDRFGPKPCVGLLRELVRRRCNIVISGATSSGKSTLLAALAAQVPPFERLITMEDIAELAIDHPHVVRLEVRPATADGVGEVPLAALVRTALRLRPDRLVVGEVRGDEAADLMQALNTGHDGSLATVHANSACDAVDRLVGLVGRTAPGWPATMIANHVRRAVDVVVHVGRGVDGSRSVLHIDELGGDADGAHTRVLWSAAHPLTVAALQRGRRS